MKLLELSQKYIDMAQKRILQNQHVIKFLNF